MKGLLEKYLLRSIPGEGEGKGGGSGDGGNGGDDKGSMLQVQQKPPVFDMTAIGADMNDGAEQTKDFVISEENAVAFPDERAEAGEGDDEGDELTPEQKAAKEAEEAKAKEKAGAGDGKKPDAGKKADGEGGEDGELPAWTKRRLERQQRKHEREMAELRQQVEELKKGGKAEASAADDPGPAPVASDYSDFEEYMEAKTAHEAKVKAAKEAKAKNPPKQAGQPDAAAKPDVELVDAIADIRGVLEDTAPDLWKKVTEKADLQISRDMVLTIAEADFPQSILQQLLEKPEEADRISKLSPRRQAIELNKLDVEKPVAKTPAAPPPKRSTAPEPIKPLDGRAEVDKGYDTSDFAAFEARRREDEKRHVDSSDLWL